MTGSEDLMTVSNNDLFLYALYRLGGAGKYVDVEDVFMEMWQLAPSRFSWRKYKQPNYKLLSQTIWDLKRHDGSDLLLGEGYSRQLSASGVQWIEQRLPELSEATESTESAVSNKRPSQKVVVNLEKSTAYLQFQEDDKSELDKNQVASAFRCSPDAPRSVWRERLETLRSAATDADRPEVLRFLDHLETVHADWFGGGK
jgi:hypothetical protein